MDAQMRSIHPTVKFSTIESDGAKRETPRLNGFRREDKS